MNKKCKNTRKGLTKQEKQNSAREKFDNKIWGSTRTIGWQR